MLPLSQGTQPGAASWAGGPPVAQKGFASTTTAAALAARSCGTTLHAGRTPGVGTLPGHPSQAVRAVPRVSTGSPETRRPGIKLSCSRASSCFLTQPVWFLRADTFPHRLPGSREEAGVKAVICRSQAGPARTPSAGPQRHPRRTRLLLSNASPRPCSELAPWGELLEPDEPW